MVSTLPADSDQPLADQSAGVQLRLRFEWVAGLQLAILIGVATPA